jgi:hypothetical protein
VLSEVFTPRELRARIVRPSGLRVMQDLDTTVSPESWDNLARYVNQQGEIRTRTGRQYPHILLAFSRSVWTSVCLALQKDG